MNSKLRSLSVALLAFVFLWGAQWAHAEENAGQQQGAQKEANNPDAAKQGQPSSPEQKSFGNELVEEKRRVTGADKEEEQEENSNLTHGRPVRWLAHQVGMSVHGAHLFLFCLNFAVIVIVAVWAGRKILPPVFRNRTATIQQALEEARTASQDANRRLADIETRLRQLDVEIGQMQANAEKEAVAEEARIQKTTEEDVKKVVHAAEQEIAAAAKQARRELSAHTAGLAIALARQQINVDANTDQVLVRSFASTLAAKGPSNDGKDGR